MKICINKHCNCEQKVEGINLMEAKVNRSSSALKREAMKFS